MQILITGVAGFIGFSVARELLIRGDSVIGLDNLNDYYDPKLKQSRLEQLKDFDEFNFFEKDLSVIVDVESVFLKFQPDCVVHLAAQAGVQYSIENPEAYISSNLVGFANLLEAVRRQNCPHLVYASTSSVYGANEKIPFEEGDRTDSPITLYAATKKSNELMAHSYSHLFNLPMTGLRFFTVYGPWGRPDMALFKFTKNILEGEPIDLYNHGNHTRDFTFIDDLVEGLLLIIDSKVDERNTISKTKMDSTKEVADHTLYNIGSNNPVKLKYFVEVLENKLNRKAIKNYMDLQPGDVKDTHANVDRLISDFGYKPQTSIEHGISKFVDWFMDYYNVPDPNHNVP